MIYKRCSRCGKRIPSGSQCECQKIFTAERHRMYDRYQRDKRSKDFYNSKHWEQTRTAVLELDAGIDVYLFMTKGEIKYADTVHHIEPLREHWDRRYDPDNLMSLHHDTHSMIEKNFYQNGDTTIIQRLKKMLNEYREQRG